MRLSPLSYLPFASRASLPVAVAAGRRRQQRFPWLSRQTGSYEIMERRGGAEKKKEKEAQREQTFLHLCASDRYSVRERGHMVHVSVDVSERKKQTEESHTWERTKNILHGEFKDFPHRVNAASYRPRALKITQITDQYIRMQCVHHPCRVNLPAFPIHIQTIQLLSREAFLLFYFLFFLTALNKLSPAARRNNTSEREETTLFRLLFGLFAIVTAMRTQVAFCLMFLGEMRSN